MSNKFKVKSRNLIWQHQFKTDASICDSSEFTQKPFGYGLDFFLVKRELVFPCSIKSRLTWYEIKEKLHSCHPILDHAITPAFHSRLSTNWLLHRADRQTEVNLRIKSRGTKQATANESGNRVPWWWPTKRVVVDDNFLLHTRYKVERRLTSFCTSLSTCWHVSCFMSGKQWATPFDSVLWAYPNHCSHQQSSFSIHGNLFWKNSVKGAAS